MIESIQKLTDVLKTVDDYIEQNGIGNLVDDVIIFQQTCGDTSCGCGGAGGQTITLTYVVVLEINCKYGIFFNGRFAYWVDKPSEIFYKDLACRWLAGPTDKKRIQYEEKIDNGK